MENEVERYNFLQKISGLSKKEFAESLGLSKAYGYQIATGRLKATRPILEKLSAAYQVNLNWYLFGRGEPFQSLDEAEITLLDQEAAAGQGRDIEDYLEKKSVRLPASLIAPYKPKNLQAVYVAGESMTGANINNGDIVVFYPGLVKGNGIYVVSYDNSLMVKNVEIDGPGQAISLISANPDFPVRRFTGAETENLRLAGLVVACVHKVC
jgi:SOS-response transcriptional repressor LexA